MALINCPECGKEISDMAKSCPNCGFEMQSEKFVQEITCPFCGAYNHPKAEYCLECSMRLVSYENMQSPSHNVDVTGPVVENKKKNGVKRFTLMGLFIFTLFLIFSFVDNDVETITNTQATKVEEKADGETAESAEIKEIKEIKIVGEEEIYAGNDVLINVSNIEEAEKSTKINFIITNNSSEDYSMAAHTYSINKLMAGGHLYGADTEVPSNKKSKLTIEIENQWLSDNSVSDIREMDVIFWAYKDNFKEWDSGKVQIRTNLYQEKEYFVEKEKEIYSDSNISLWYVKNNENEYAFIIKNNSSYNAEYTVEKCSVNDWGYDLVQSQSYNLYGEPIHSGTFDTFIINIDSDFMYENNITNIENITFSIKMDEANWDFKGSPWEVSTDKISLDINLIEG